MLWSLLACTSWLLPPVTNPTAAAPPPVAPPPAPVVVAVPASPPGSLWSEVGSRSLIGMDGNARRIGDLITVLISESASTSLDATTDTSRTGSASLGVTALMGLETSLIKANEANMTNGLTLGGETATAHSGTGKTSRTGSLTATLTCEVQEVLPNGNLRIRGTKAVRVNRETQYLTLEGVVRPRDILLDNTVRSDVLANAKVEFTGSGAVSAKQTPGWGSVVLDTVSPF
jgi:flagellar L-ring protein FlgH